MASETLFQQLNYEKAYRDNRLRAAHWVLAHLNTFPELLAYCFKDDSRLSYKAVWVLEFVCREDLSVLYPHLDYFFTHLPKAKLDQAVRPLSFMCELLAIAYYKKKDPKLMGVFTAEHKNVMTESSFDWLISDQKVACQVRAMTALFYLGTEYDWIHPELNQIIRERMHLGSAGYKSRGRRILELIDTFQK